MKVIESNTNAEAPSGSTFLVDSCPFTPGKQIDLSTLELDQDSVRDWPMVYILANQDKAYVGQTTSIANRLNQHSANEEKSEFTTANVIYNDEFNASVITDYEHRLIGLMHADGRYQLTNKNDGMTDTNYFSKDRYSYMFVDLWDELKKKDLVTHTIDEIEQSEVFKYSPYKSLNSEQQDALQRIMEQIDKGLEGREPIVVEGMPGTGKTVLAIYLLKMLKDNPKYKSLNIRLVEPVTSLRTTLSQSFSTVNGLSEHDVMSPTDINKEKYGYKDGEEKSFDILLIDETHKLKRRKNLGTQYGNYDKVSASLGLEKESTQVDWILQEAKLPIFFYDPFQSVGPSCIEEADFRKTIGRSIARPIRLKSQMRVRGGKSYLDYVLAILNDENPTRKSFNNYDVCIHSDFSEFIQSFESSLNDDSLTRMMSGYAWEWKSKKDKTGDVKDIIIDGIGLRWNCTYDNWVVKGAKDQSIAHEVGCIHSTQGYDLSRAYVIIGDDLWLTDEDKLVANKSSYFDRNGKATTTEETLTEFVKHIYYVLLTRGINATHIYVANERLREYLSKYFDVI